jgi:hypothetical protein
MTAGGKHPVTDQPSDQPSATHDADAFPIDLSVARL